MNFLVKRVVSLILSIHVITITIILVFAQANEVEETVDEVVEYDRDTCFCPHPHSHLTEHLYETDDALRDLILRMNREYYQSFLKEPSAIYRIPGTALFFFG